MEKPHAAYNWQPPTPKEPTEKKQLRVLNSFTRKKEVFIPNERKSIRWYCCGPTVYDVAHLGHARCYITFDIIRRILAGYFGYNVFYVINITDIDDKIIKRARSNHLCDKFIEKLLDSLQQTDSPTGTKEQCIAEISRYIDNFGHRRVEEQDRDKLNMIESVVRNSKNALDELDTLLRSEQPPSRETLNIPLNKLRDVIADEQDFKYGDTIDDHQIFKSLTLNYEQEYHEDMSKLDVLPPNALTRVSEFIEEIGLYIKRLEENGYAYRSAGSIYFNTEKFDTSERHSYAKLVREAYGEKKCFDEGEGELSKAQTAEKKSPNDFALWKKSKTGEPAWKCQDFEPGRPGWHIECSVMASKLLGENFDIHAGGHDLRFPHHDNEIAQAEAYYDTGKNWVNYFLHSGHLTISGCKMSKSLKNFITIRQALDEYTSRQLRFAFLAHGWAETLDYSTNTMSTALSYEKIFREFFLNTSDALRRSVLAQESPDCQSPGATICDEFKKWTDRDLKLNFKFENCVNLVDEALCDNFDTRSALNHLSALVKDCNKSQDLNHMLLRDIACFIKRILSIFGVEFGEIDLESYINRRNNTLVGENNVSNQEVVLKYVEALAQFRADIRRIAKTGEPQQSICSILKLCDNLRDQTMPSLGVRLEDRETGSVPYVVKFVSKETLERERALAEKKEHEKKLRDETLKLEKLKVQQQRDEKAKVPPSEMFRSQSDKYSQFDAKGMPTHDSTGKEISKSAIKKLQRLYAEQEARYNRYLESKNT